MKAIIHLILILPFVASGCSKQHTKSPPLSVPESSHEGLARTNETPESQDQRLIALQSQASLLLETTDWSNVTVIAPALSNHSSQPITNIDTYLPIGNKHGYAVVTVPPQKAIGDSRESGAEVILNISDAVIRAGYSRAYFVTRPHGFFMVEVYPQGLPSRKEAERMNREISKGL